jgi:DNA replication and repair protein RecF
MRLTHLHCQSFRCLEDTSLEPGEGVNILRGDNAQGKTSMLEALLFLATSKSHRTNSDEELLMHGAEHFHLRAEVRRQGEKVVLEANYWRGVKRFRVNGVAQARISDILGRVLVVFFSPEDVALVRGTAAQRRRFLDMELSQVSMPYLQALQQYRQILRQRNELLRADRPDPALLDAWEQPLAQHGAVLMRERAGFIEELAELAGAAYGRIAPAEALNMRYQPDVRDPDALAEVFRSGRDSDIHNRQTMRGPHRDDMLFEVGGRPARQYASQGQQRTAALALKLAELALVRRRTGEYPVFMLDDVLSELDPKRSERLLEAVDRGAQCLLTTTDLAGSGPAFADRAHNFRIEGGHVRPEQ